MIPSPPPNESSRDIPAFLNTTVIASAVGYAPQLLHRRDGSPGAVLCPIPFCARATFYQSGVGLSGSEKQQQLLHAIADYYHQQYHQEACLLRGERKLPVIATGHLNHRRRQQKRDAVRDIYIGTLDAFRRSISSGLYRIRHIHRAQCVGGMSISAIGIRPSPQL